MQSINQSVKSAEKETAVSPIVEEQQLTQPPIVDPAPIIHKETKQEKVPQIDNSVLIAQLNDLTDRINQLQASLGTVGKRM